MRQNRFLERSIPARQHPHPHRWKALFLFGLFCQIGLNPLFAASLPSGASVVAGSAAIGVNGTSMNIVNSNGAIINWQEFSIGNGYLVNFAQANASSAVLNRVVGSNLSAIYGTLTSNGKVFLINPNGVLVGASGIINTAGFTASTLDIDDSQFTSGGSQLHFMGASTAKVQNFGLVTATDGNVFLIAHQVENNGTLNAAKGTVGLYASDEVYLTCGNADAGSVRIASPGGVSAATGVLNTGAINAVRAELKATGNLYALAINNTGIIRATGAVVRNGAVHFVSTGGTIQNSGTIVAKNADGSGGEVRLRAGTGGTVVDSGTVDVSSQTAGKKGGTIELSGDYVAVDGGLAVTITHNPNGTYGTLLGATGSPPAPAVLDASGPGGGGTILIGGDAHGANPSVHNALVTYFGPDAIAKADATDNGDGGKVVVWGNDTTRFYGQISAQGGPNGGNGGWVETSGHVLDAQGIVNTLAVRGQKGTWLLDPYNLTIDGPSSASDFAINNATPFAPSGTASNLSAYTLLFALGTGNVEVTTSGGGSEAGILTVNTALSWTAATTLTLDAPTINLNAAISYPNGALAGTASTVNVGAAGLVQNGVDAAAAGGTVNLAQTTYLLTSQVTIAKNLTVNGYNPTDATQTVLDGQGSTGVLSIGPPGTTVTLNGLTIQNGSSGNGGGIFNDHSNLTLNYVALLNNTASNIGGAIYNDSYNGLTATLTVNHSTFSGNTATIQGGAIYNDADTGGNATLNINNSTLTGNTADGGGAIYSNGRNSGVATVTITDSTLSSNTATTSGGAIFNDGTSSGSAALTLNHVTLSSNEAVDGGALYNDGASSGSAAITIENNSTLSANTASTGAGGAIFNDGAATLSIDGSTFSSNTTFLYGGAIESRNEGSDIPTATISNSTFSDNTASSDAGAIDNQRGAFTISNSTFQNNSTPGYGAGAIYDNGAGGSSQPVTLILVNDTFIGNSAGSGGGAVYNDGGNSGLATITVTGTTFSGNSVGSGDGGALYNDASNGGTAAGTFTGGAFTGNAASGHGGAVYNLAGTATLTFTDTAFSSNTDSDAAGNGVYNDGGTVTFLTSPTTSALVQTVVADAGHHTDTSTLAPVVTATSLDPDHDTANPTADGKKNATLGNRPDTNRGDAAPGGESEVGAGSSGALIAAGGANVPVPPQVLAHFNQVLGSAVMGRLQTALQP